MYTYDLAIPEFKSTAAEAIDLLQKILEGVPATNEALKVTPDHSLFTGGMKCDSLYVLREGNVKYERNGRLLYIYEEGDLIGFEYIYMDPSARLNTDFAVIVDEYSSSDLYNAIGSDMNKLMAWNRFLSLHINLQNMIISDLIKVQVSHTPEIRNYETGDIIIEEGTRGNEVFTMLSGSAEVYVGNVRVGEIHDSETFGAIAVLTGMERTATVKAESPCTIVVAAKESYKELLASQPNAVVKLVEDMTRVIVSTNNRVVKLTEKLASKE